MRCCSGKNLAMFQIKIELSMDFSLGWQATFLNFPDTFWLFLNKIWENVGYRQADELSPTFMTSPWPERFSFNCYFSVADLKISRFRMFHLGIFRHAQLTSARNNVEVILIRWISTYFFFSCALHQNPYSSVTFQHF